MTPSREHRLSDQLREGLKVVFVGTAAGRHSAQVGQYYAKPGNRFWRALHDAGITPREYSPHEFGELPALGIGLTDLSRIGAGMDHEIASAHYDIVAFNAKLLRLKPRSVAFTSKRATALWRGMRSTAKISYGRQSERPSDFPEVFVLTSPSGAASRYWDLGPWRELGDFLAEPTAKPVA